MYVKELRMLSVFRGHAGPGLSGAASGWICALVMGFAAAGATAVGRCTAAVMRAVAVVVAAVVLYVKMMFRTAVSSVAQALAAVSGPWTIESAAMIDGTTMVGSCWVKDNTDRTCVYWSMQVSVSLRPERRVSTFGAMYRKVLVLDLDETLIHSKLTPHNGFDAELLTREQRAVYIHVRPHLAKFLRTAARWYNVCVFTSAVRSYADPIVDYIDPHGLIQSRFYRDSCTPTASGGYVKDVTVVCKDLPRVVVVDNTPLSYSHNAANAIPVSTWTDDAHDTQLLDMLQLLHALYNVSDVRSVLSLRYTGGRLQANAKVCAM